MQFLAGQVLTADDLDVLVTRVVQQGTNQSVTSSTSLVDSGIVVPVDGLTLVKLRGRYEPGGGGIRMAWRVTGTVDGTRAMWMPGQGGTGGATGVNSYQQRSLSNLAFEWAITQFSTSNTLGFAEDLRLTGVGDAVFRFAQQSSHASSTVLRADSWAEWQRGVED